MIVDREEGRGVKAQNIKKETILNNDVASFFLWVLKRIIWIGKSLISPKNAPHALLVSRRREYGRSHEPHSTDIDQHQLLQSTDLHRNSYPSCLVHSSVELCVSLQKYLCKKMCLLSSLHKRVFSNGIARLWPSSSSFCPSSTQLHTYTLPCLSLTSKLHAHKSSLLPSFLYPHHTYAHSRYPFFCLPLYHFHFSSSFFSLFLYSGVNICSISSISSSSLSFSSSVFLSIPPPSIISTRSFTASLIKLLLRCLPCLISPSPSK